MPKRAPRRKFKLKTARRPPAGRPKIDYESELNPEQLAAVTADPGPVLIIAGAGTGKTRAITYRVAWLIERFSRPEEVMLLTFTNRAAREMLGRVEGLLGRSVKAIWGGTFHHVGNGILRRYAGRLGYKRTYTILDREDSKSLLRACAAERKVEKDEERFPQPGVLMAVYSLAVNTQTPAADVVSSRYPHLLGRLDAICEVLKSYEKRKRQAGVMDYDDLLMNWLVLLEEHEDVRETLRKRTEHVLVDEYQDTNILQARIVDFMAGRDERKNPSVTVVGDDAQAIYSWRGASADNILTFPERYPDCRVFRLETNYRSTPEVLEVGNRALVHLPRRFEKNLRAVRAPGALPEVVPCRDALQQAEFVAERILEALEEGRDLREISVLYRSHWNSLEIELELQRRNIPFRVRGGLRFFEQAHIKDVAAFVRAALNPRDELAWLRIMPLAAHVGPRTARAVADKILESNSPRKVLLKAVECAPRKARKALGEIARLVIKLSTPEMLSVPSEMIAKAVHDFYADYMASRFPNARSRRQDLDQLARYASQFRSCQGFLADLALSGVTESETSPVGPEEDEFMTLSTVHQAKGLEWPLVFVVWLADGRFPTDFAGRTAGGYEEERRLFHVAATRARDELVLAYPMTYRKRSSGPSGEGKALMKPSRFLVELDEGRPCYELVEIEEE